MVGLGIALAAGALSAFAGDAFLTGQWLYLAGLPLSTVLVFDIGVYLVVFGAVLTLVFASLAATHPAFVAVGTRAFIYPDKRAISEAETVPFVDDAQL